MTKNEAVYQLYNIFKWHPIDDKTLEAVDMAIKALEKVDELEKDLQPTCNNLATNLQVDAPTNTPTDLISRQDAIKEIEQLPNAPNGWSDTYDKAYIIGVLDELPSAESTGAMEREGE